MKHVVTGWDHLFGPWLMEQTDGDWTPGRGRTIGLFDVDRGIRAACLYSDCNGASVVMHCAGLGRDWLNREFLWVCFDYPFVQLGVNKIISPVESTNAQCRKFIEHLGFQLEATLKSAAPKGDLLLYSLAKADCKWLDLKGKYSGEVNTTYQR